MIYLLMTLLIIVAAILLILVVLVQNPKGSGLGAGFGGGSSNVMGGAQRTSDILEKATWGLLGFILIAAVLSTAFVPGNDANRIDTSNTIETIIEE